MEGGAACEEIEGEGTECPPINSVVIFLLLDDFGGHVFWSTSHGSAAVVVGGDLTEAKVGEEEVALVIEEAVLRFEVSIDNSTLGVEMVKGESETG